MDEKKVQRKTQTKKEEYLSFSSQRVLRKIREVEIFNDNGKKNIGGPAEGEIVCVQKSLQGH